MKKITFILTIMLLIALSPAWAAFCHHCGKELPAAANFCPGCGKAAAGAFEQAQPATPVSTQAVSPTVTPAPVYIPTVNTAILDDTSIADYDSVNQMELLLTNTNYQTASRQAATLRANHNNRMAALNNRYQSFSPYQRKLHDLHILKFKALENYLEAWRSSETGPDKARAQAEKDKALFILAQTNEAIDTLLTGGTTLASLAQVEEIERRINKTTANYVVTAPYILVDNQRLNRGEPIWVIDVASANAKVLHMGRGRSSTPICGWVSVYDLEKRSNWRSDPAFFYSAPTTIVYEPRPEPPVKVVIVTKKRYPYKHRHDKHRHGKYDKYDKYDKRYPDGGHHKHYDYVVIKPNFW